MKKTIAIITLLSFASCTSGFDRLDWVCNCHEREKANIFVTNNLKASNNMSDEEMEDVIRELRNTGIVLNCHQKILRHNQDGQLDCIMIKLDSCETVHELVR